MYWNIIRPRHKGPSGLALIELPAVRKRKAIGFTLIELPAVRKRKAIGFTLIELLVVIGIIGLLLGIAVPTISQALRSAEAAKTEARISSLSGGAQKFHNDHQYYPGQKRDPDMPGEFDNGSQWLAYEMFVDRTNDEWPGADTYLPYREDLLCKIKDTDDGDSRARTFSDGFGKPMAILYWPSKIGGDPDGDPDSEDSTVPNVYAYGDCSAYVTGSHEEDFNDFAWDKRFDKVRNHDSFLLLGAGPDREYFTGDDISNTSGT